MVKQTDKRKKKVKVVVPPKGTPKFINLPAGTLHIAEPPEQPIPSTPSSEGRNTRGRKDSREVELKRKADRDPSKFVQKRKERSPSPILEEWESSEHSGSGDDDEDEEYAPKEKELDAEEAEEEESQEEEQEPVSTPRKSLRTSRREVAHVEIPKKKVTTSSPKATTKPPLKKMKKASDSPQKVPSLIKPPKLPPLTFRNEQCRNLYYSHCDVKILKERPINLQDFERLELGSVLAHAGLAEIFRLKEKMTSIISGLVRSFYANKRIDDSGDERVLDTIVQGIHIRLTVEEFGKILKIPHSGLILSDINISNVEELDQGVLQEMFVKIPDVISTGLKPKMFSPLGWAVHIFVKSNIIPRSGSPDSPSKAIVKAMYAIIKGEKMNWAKIILDKLMDWELTAVSSFLIFPYLISLVLKHYKVRTVGFITEAPAIPINRTAWDKSLAALPEADRKIQSDLFPSKTKKRKSSEAASETTAPTAMEPPPTTSN